MSSSLVIFPVAAAHLFLCYSCTSSIFRLAHETNEDNGVIAVDFDFDVVVPTDFVAIRFGIWVFLRLCVHKSEKKGEREEKAVFCVYIFVWSFCFLL